jgi:hypothetical protein
VSPAETLTAPSSDDCTPLPAMPCDIPDGNTAGGQILVQPPADVHVTLPPFSDASTYRVRPFPLTRTVPSPGTLAALTVTEAFDALDPPVAFAGAAAGTAVLVTGGADVLLDEPHAARRMDTPVTARMGKATVRCRLERTDKVIWASQVGQRTFGVAVIRRGGPYGLPRALVADMNESSHFSVSSKPVHVVTLSLGPTPRIDESCRASGRGVRRFYVHPSPSVGPPELSASWSPRPPCGMQFIVGAVVVGAIVIGGRGGRVVAGGTGLVLGRGGAVA